MKNNTLPQIVTLAACLFLNAAASHAKLRASMSSGARSGPSVSWEFVVSAHKMVLGLGVEPDTHALSQIVADGLRYSPKERALAQAIARTAIDPQAKATMKTLMSQHADRVSTELLDFQRKLAAHILDSFEKQTAANPGIIPLLKNMSTWVPKLTTDFSTLESAAVSFGRFFDNASGDQQAAPVHVPEQFTGATANEPRLAPSNSDQAVPKATSLAAAPLDADLLPLLAPAAPKKRSFLGRLYSAAKKAVKRSVIPIAISLAISLPVALGLIALNMDKGSGVAVDPFWTAVTLSSLPILAAALIIYRRRSGPRAPAEANSEKEEPQSRGIYPIL